MTISNSITEIMTENVVSIEQSASLEQAEQVFVKNKIRHLPVLKDEKLVGMLSLTDLKRMSFTSKLGDEEANVDNVIYQMLSVEQVMMSRPVSVQKDATIRDVAEILSSKEFHALPILDGETLVGIVSTTDLIRYMIKAASVVTA